MTIQRGTIRLPVFADSSAYYATADRNDRSQRQSLQIAGRAQQIGLRSYTTRYVLAETHALIVSRRRNSRLALAFLREIERSRATTVVAVDETDESRAREILARYEDHLFSLTDAISFAVMERLGLAYAFTFDSDFAAFGFTPPSLNFTPLSLDLRR